MTEPAARSATSSPLLVFHGDHGLRSGWMEGLRRLLPRFPRAIRSQWAGPTSLGLIEHDVPLDRHRLPGGAPVRRMPRPTGD